MTTVNDDPTHDLGLVDMGEWLVQRRGLIDAGEVAWLAMLAEFDLRQGWAADGQLSCVNWLMWRCKMARATAFEKLRVAHELRRRPRLAAAYTAGELSYSAVRSITRLDDASVEVDEALIDLAKAGTVADLERAIRHHEIRRQQDHGGDLDRYNRRGLHLRRGYGGIATLEANLTDLELDQTEACLRAFMDHDNGEPADPEALFDPPDVDESSAGDSSTAPDPVVLWWQARADAFMAMVRTALAHVGEGRAMGVDTYMVHVVANLEAGAYQRIDGTPIDQAAFDEVACDASAVAHLLANGTEPVALGRKTRVWTTAQRRAITVRDRHRCRWPDCHHTDCDIHHVIPWSQGGPTDASNGILGCPRHHTLMHAGFKVIGDANGTLEFYRPDGGFLGTSRPPASPPT